jgi:hypothetical protein
MDVTDDSARSDADAGGTAADDLGVDRRRTSGLAALLIVGRGGLLRAPRAADADDDFAQRQRRAARTAA